MGGLARRLLIQLMANLLFWFLAFTPGAGRAAGWRSVAAVRVR